LPCGCTPSPSGFLPLLPTDPNNSHQRTLQTPVPCHPTSRNIHKHLVSSGSSVQRKHLKLMLSPDSPCHPVQVQTRLRKSKFTKQPRGP
jgi:hypothetical protein